MNGLLLVDKPSGVTSHDVVDKIRRASGMRRVGHTGTLDPGATGLLVLCLGVATRLSEHLTGLDKVYEGAMRLGIVTDSYDMDGKVLEENPVPEDLTAEDIQRACDAYTGDIMQVPPMVSAVKVGGERLYKRARQGEVVERAPRQVTVREFVVLGYEPPMAQIRVKCTRGTYVRSLCHDVGRELGCGATLASLRRTYVGQFRAEDALGADEFKEADDVASRLIPIDSALTLPSVTIRPGARSTVVSGAALNGDDLDSGCPVSKGWVQIKTGSGQLLALGEIRTGPMGIWIHPRRVFVE